MFGTDKRKNVGVAAEGREGVDLKKIRLQEHPIYLAAAANVARILGRRQEIKKDIEMLRAAGYRPRITDEAAAYLAGEGVAKIANVSERQAELEHELRVADEALKLAKAAQTEAYYESAKQIRAAMAPARAEHVRELMRCVRELRGAVEKLIEFEEAIVDRGVERGRPWESWELAWSDTNRHQIRRTLDKWLEGLEVGEKRRQAGEPA